jgi:hypothetical protein
MGGIFGGGDAPKAPDPNVVAAAQTKSNKETAREQARLAMTGQTSDFGSVSYVSDPNSPSGYRAVQSLAPEEQALLAQQRDLRANLGDSTNTALNNVSGMLAGGPFDLTAARGRELSDIQQTFLDPQWQQNDDALENQLINKGIRPGSPQYEIAKKQFSDQRQQAYNRMFLDAFTTANNAALTERNLPLSDYATLMGTVSPVSPNIPTASAPTPGVAPTDIGSYIYNSFNAANQQHQANQGGLFGLLGNVGSAFAGSQAGSAAISSALGMLSDRRTKVDVVPVGRIANGLTVYDFKYRDGDGLTYRGLMADEVASVRPDAVKRGTDGFDRVDYLKAVA